MKHGSELDIAHNNLNAIYAENAYNALPYGICTLDWQCNILWANQQFYGQIKENNDIQQPENYLKNNPNIINQLKNLLAGQSNREIIAVNTINSENSYFSFKTIHKVHNEYITFLVSEFETLPDQIEKALQYHKQKYDLTVAEMAVAKLLTLGFSSEDIRQERKVSISTVRAQKRHLREKMNLQSSMAIATHIYAYCLSELT